jgi:hypothetical protein
MAQVVIAGNTYPVKDQLKSLGAKWDPDQRCWTITDKKIAEAQKIVAATLKPAATGKCSKCGKPCDPKYSTCYDHKPVPTQCKQCGKRPGPRGWPRIYRNGICSDCYRDGEDDMPTAHNFTRADGSRGTWMEY